MSITPETLRDIFYSGYPVATCWQVLDELFVALHRDAITYKKVQLAPKKEFYAASSAVNGIDGLGPQEKGHMALKELAMRWLWQRYQIKGVYEAQFNGLHPDVRSVDNRFVIECGTTDPSCVQIFLNDNRVLWVANIPYPFLDDLHMALHIFGRGKNYAVWQEQKADRMRDVFRKFHRR